MIRINVTLLLEDIQRKDAVKFLATELVEKSQHDKGCIDYDLYDSTTVDNHMLIYETWENAKDLEAHSNSDHFKTIVPKLQELATMTIEQFDF